jgi:hypothetical protein
MNQAPARRHRGSNGGRTGLISAGVAGGVEQTTLADERQPCLLVGAAYLVELMSSWER